MKNLHYALRVTTKPRWSNFWKVFSLALGILIGSVILCRTAFFSSYDSYIPHRAQTYFLTADMTLGSDTFTGNARLLPAMAPTMIHEVPMVESATRFHRMGLPISSDRGDFDFLAVRGDSLFFDIFPIGVVEGSYDELFRDESGVALSRSSAEAIFGTTDIIGRAVTSKGEPLTVRAVFEDFPANSYHRGVDVIFDGDIPSDLWHSDSYFTFFTLSGKPNLTELNTLLNTTFAPHLKADEVSSMVEIDIKVQPFDRFSEFAQYGNAGAAAMNYVFVIIGICVMVIVSLNFALMQINSLVSRYKEVGVHKASGATTKQIFGLVITETALYTLYALLLAVGMLFLLQAPLEAIFAQRLADILALDYLWAVGIVILSIIVVAGVIPAIIFARIPVSSIFRNLRSTNLWWKQVLLFTEVLAAMTVITVTLGAWLQYSHAMNLDLGYNHDKLYTLYIYNSLSEEEAQTLKSQIMQLPEIDDITIISTPLIEGWSGMGVHSRASGEMLLSSRENRVDSNFFSLLGIELLEGSASMMSYEDPLVNEHLLDVLGTTLQQDAYGFETSGRAVGTFRNIKQNVYSPLTPMVIFERNAQVDWQRNVMIIKGVDEANGEVRAKIQEITDRLHPTKKFEATTYEQDIEGMNIEIREVRDGIGVGALILIITTFIGVVSYISTEIKARQRQIVIRRTYGASIANIVMLVGKRLFIVSGIAAVFATIGGYYILSTLISILPHGIELSWWLIVSGTVMVGLIIFLVIYYNTRRIARREYVRLIGKV